MTSSLKIDQSKEGRMQALPAKISSEDDILRTLTQLYGFVFVCGVFFTVGGILANPNWYEDLLENLFTPSVNLWVYLAAVLCGFAGPAIGCWWVRRNKNQQARAEYRQAIRLRLAKCSYDQLKSQIQANPRWLKYIWNPTQEITLIAIQSDPTVIQTSVHMKEEAFRCRAIETNPEVMDQLPKRQRTAEVWKVAISQDWKWIQSCPTKHQTEEVCLIAARQSNAALKWIQNYDIQARVRDIISVGENSSLNSAAGSSVPI